MARAYREENCKRNGEGIEKRKMLEEKFCDFCGREESALVGQKELTLTIDEDGLWSCSDCRERVSTEPVGDGWDVALDEKLVVLIGQSAGAICRTLNLPQEEPYLIVLNVASQIAYDDDQFMSDWLFVNQWLDGSTVWRAPDGRGLVTVKPDGSIQINV